MQQHAGNDPVGQPQVPLPGTVGGGVIVVGHGEGVVILSLGAGCVGQGGVLGGLYLAQARCFEELSGD